MASGGNSMNGASPNDLVSVIVPVYNSSSCLHYCIDSILKQSYREIEVILVDDGSTDGSGEICDAYAKNDYRIRVLHTPNCGVSAARNTGINASTGAFIFFIDSDDFIETYAIQVLVEGCNQSRADMVVGAFNKVKNGNIVAQVRDFSDNQLLTKKGVIDYAMSYLQNPRRHQMLMSSWAKLFRSAIVKNNHVRYDTELRTSEDVAFNFDYLKNTETVYFINNVIYNQQKHGTYNSLSMRLLENDPRSLFGFIAALDHVRAFLRDGYDEVEIDRAIGHYYIYHIVLYLIRVCGQIDNANKYKVYGLVRELINAPDFRRHIKHYIPAEGNYKAIPLLMKSRLVLPVIGVCWYEAHKQYGKGSGTK